MPTIGFDGVNLICLTGTPRTAIGFNLFPSVPSLLSLNLLTTLASGEELPCDLDQFDTNDVFTIQLKVSVDLIPRTELGMRLNGAINRRFEQSRAGYPVTKSFMKKVAGNGTITAPNVELLIEKVTWRGNARVGSAISRMCSTRVAIEKK